MIDDPATHQHLSHIFALLPWALEQMQQEIGALTFLDLESGTKATIAHNLAMREAERRFADFEGIDVVRSKGLFHFVLPDVLVRIKLAQPRTLKISTNRTQQTFEWTHQQLALDGIADPRDRLHLVYVPDKLWTKVTRSAIGVYEGNEAKAWHDIDVDAWYESSDRIDPTVTEVDIQPLKLKPGIMPLEENDGTA